MEEFSATRSRAPEGGDGLDGPAVGQPPGALAKLLLLTGQRRTEVADMEWREINLDKSLWSLPSDRTKNGKPHVVPLSRQAAAIIAAFPANRDLVLVAGRAFGNFSRAKDRIDARMPAIPAWTWPPTG